MKKNEIKKRRKECGGCIFFFVKIMNGALKEMGGQCAKKKLSGKKK